jgi:hypothetical protein
MATLVVFGLAACCATALLSDVAERAPQAMRASFPTQSPSKACWVADATTDDIAGGEVRRHTELA